MQLTYRVRAYPTKRQHGLLRDYLDHTRELYNACLDERQNCYRKTGRSINKYEQSRELTELRRDEAYTRYPRRLQRWTINLVDAAYQGMFHRAREKKGGTRTGRIGFPRFRGREYWNTIGWDSPVDFTMRARGLHNRKAFGGTLRLRPDRPLPPPADLKMMTMTVENDRWFANLTYEVPDKAAKSTPARPVGVDMGLICLAMRSDGVPMSPARQSVDDTSELRRAHRALGRCRKRSKRRRRAKAQVRRVYAKIVRRRKAALHVISARLTHHFDAVAVENLNVAGLNQGGGGGAKGRGVRKSWRDRAPGQLLEQLKWKTTRDGRAFAEVDPRFTTIECNRCHAHVRKDLRQRVHRCECGEVSDRDHNAARNILDRAGWSPAGANPGGNVSGFRIRGAGLSGKHGRTGRTTSAGGARASPPLHQPLVAGNTRRTVGRSDTS